MPTIIERAARGRRPRHARRRRAAGGRRRHRGIRPRDRRGRRRAAGLAQCPPRRHARAARPRRAATWDPTRGSCRARSPSRACRCSRTTRTSALRCRPSGRRWGCTAPSCETTAASTSAATRSRGCRASSSATTSASRGGFTNLGPDVADLYLERVDGDTYELDGAWPPSPLREETIEVAGGDPVTITVRSTARGPLVTDIGSDFAADRGRVPRGIRPTRRRLRGLAPVDRVDARHHAAGRLRREPRAGLERLPRGCVAVRRARAEPHLRRRRRQHRLPGARIDPRARLRRRHGAAAGLDERQRLDGHGPVRGAAVDAQPRARLHRHGQQRR